MGGEGLCGICQAPAKQACGGCGSVFYCGRDHQRKHWPTHKQECQPYRVVSSPEAGQYLVAGRPLKAGQAVVKDVPLVVGPLASSPLCCLGCTAIIVTEDFVKCPQCQWPLCSVNCATSSDHKEECLLLARDTKRIGVPTKLGESARYDIIMILRCLLLRSSNPTGWNILLNMASHIDRRMEAMNQYHKVTVYYLLQLLKLDYDAESVNQVHGAIATNSLEIRSIKGTRMRAVYPRIRLLNHSCIPNIHLTCGTNGVMEARTAVAIEVGEPLHICYTGTVLPIWDRQESLHENYCFDCFCSRCEDPTELGTYFSSPKCSQCKDTYLEPSGKTQEIKWECPQCKAMQSASVIKEKVNEWLYRINMENLFEGPSPQQISTILEEVEKSFHPTHYIWMKVAQSALWNMRQNDPTPDTLQLRRDLWIRLLALYDKFEPGLTRRRGMSLLETAKAIYEASLYDIKANESLCVSQLQTVVSFCQEAATILGMEPPDSMEASLARKAEANKREAEELLARMGSGSTRAE